MFNLDAVDTTVGIEYDDDGHTICPLSNETADYKTCVSSGCPLFEDCEPNPYLRETLELFTRVDAEFEREWNYIASLHDKLCIAISELYFELYPDMRLSLAYIRALTDGVITIEEFRILWDK